MNNPEHRDLRWNRFERAIVWCSTHYVKAMLLLWGLAIGALIFANSFRSSFKHFAAIYLTGINDLPEWQSGLLGGQLTAIGIVFPLVVGLISVILQKKSTRVHIQGAYQLYSGYMFSGLSGLSLCAFILIGGLVSASGNSYLNKSFSVVSFLWMTLNIALSVWFFIQSLNVLDDSKRSRIMLKYFHSRLLMQYITDSIKKHWLSYPGDKLRVLNIKGIDIMPYSVGLKENEYKTLKIKRRGVVIDMYIYPLCFLLKRLKPTAEECSTLYIMPSELSNTENITLMASKNISYSRVWTWAFLQCFVEGKVTNSVNYSNFTREFFGEVYDALEDKNIGAFEGAVDNIVTTYTQLKKSFKYEGGNYLDECNGGGWLHSFNRAFYYDLVRLGREVVKTTETTSLYFSRILHVPSALCDRPSEHTSADVILSIETETDLWNCLTDWRLGNSSVLSVSQEQRHRELIAAFIGSHESWMMQLHIERKRGLSCQIYRECLTAHLLSASQIILSAVSSDDKFATDHAADHLNIWYSRTQLQRQRDWQAEHRWHSILITPDLLSFPKTEDSWRKILDGDNYNEEAAMSVAYRNAATDLRLLTAGYLIAHQKHGKCINPANVATGLLRNSVVYPTGAHTEFTHNIQSMYDVIDVIIRLESGNHGEKGSWYDVLTALTERLSGREEQYTIPGRMYSGVYSDLRSLYTSFAELALTLSPGTGGLSHSIKKALEGAVFSYATSSHLIYQLGKLKLDASEPYSGFLIEPSEYPQRVADFNKVIDEYIEGFKREKRKSIIVSSVSRSSLRAIDNNLTSEWEEVLKSDDILSLFDVYHNTCLYSSGLTLRCRSAVNKNMLIEYMEGNIQFLMPVSKIKELLINRIMYDMNKALVGRYYELDSFKAVIRQVKEMTSDEDEYVLIISGVLFCQEMQDLDFESMRKLPLNLKPVNNGLDLYPVNNCMIYSLHKPGRNFAMLVRRDYFSRLGIYRYPDGTMFTTMWLEDNSDMLKGQLISVIDVGIEYMGNIIARFGTA